jgi:hypothetical protein
MTKKRTSGVWMAVAVIVLLLVAVTAYVGAYFLRCEIIDTSNLPSKPIFRVYHTVHEAIIFKPVGRLESLITGRQVFICGPNGFIAT